MLKTSLLIISCLLLSTPSFASDDDLLLMIPAIIAKSNQFGDCSPSESEAQVFKLHNRSRSNGDSCGSYPRNPATPFKWSCKLARAAKKHSTDMFENSFTGHLGSDGSIIWDRLDEVGYDWADFGENVLSGLEDSNFVHRAVMQSPGHCSSVMSQSLTEIGIANVNGYWTMVFGRPRNP